MKIAIRNLLQNKSYTFINLLGLAIGLACCILIVLYVKHELSYDRFHTNADRLYRVVENRGVGDQLVKYASTYSALAPALKQEFSSVEYVTHIHPESGLITAPDNEKHQEENIIYADSAFFDMFSFPLLRGDPNTVLDNPLTVVLTERAAKKYFGNENPIGQTLTYRSSDNTFSLEVTGVMQNPPNNSHIQFDMIFSYLSLNTIAYWEYNVWYYPPMYTYVQLSDPEAEGALENQFPDFEKKYLGDQAASWDFELQPITEIRLFSDRQNELSPTSDITYVYLFSVIALFILIIACINFMNLSTARSMKRAREVGMRKTLGAGRGQLIRQFLSEAVIMTFFSLILAALLVEAVLPYFNMLSGKSLSTDFFASWTTPLSLIGLVLIVGIIAGSYPAFYLSSFSPVSILKGSGTQDRFSSSLFRRILVVFQFVISTGLIYGTFVIIKQLNYIQNERLGFDKEQVLIVPVREQSDQFKAATLKEEFLRTPGVRNVSAVSGVPGISSGIHDFQVIPGDNRKDTLQLMTLTVDHDYSETLGLNVLVGRDFSEEYGTDDSQAFIINETAAKKLGWEDPVGKELTLIFYMQGRLEKKGKVIGVVKDFQYHSLHKSIDPVLIHVFKFSYYHDYLVLRLATGNLQNTISSLEGKWETFNPSRPFEYSFLDETFDAMYRAEQRLSRIFSAFSIIAIFVACLGLFGLASYSTEQRTKEIGIRKVLGASVTDILGLLSKDFLKLVVIGFLIAVPIALYFMNRWLQNFADRVDIGFGIFFFVGIIALAVAILAVSLQSVRAATTNPVNSLRSE